MLCFQANNRLYHFNCPSFGLASAPWVFTKTLNPAVALGQELGMHLVVYIDNILLTAETKEKLCEQVASLIYLLRCLGFTINMEKTVMEPTQILEYLVFTLNMRAMELSLPQAKIKN